MRIWSRFHHTFRREKLNAEIEEELRLHVEDAVRDGVDEREARRAFGSMARYVEETREARVFPKLEALGSDVVFGVRQLRKHRVATLAAILTLGLAAGACGAAFRLMDALLWRPMPIADPARLYAMICRGVGPDGRQRDSYSNEYPQFQMMRAAVKGQAELIAASWVERVDVRYADGSDEIEKVQRQYVSGWLFPRFGLRPALGRLLTESDDTKLKAHPYAVISYDYWTRRFGRDPGVAGKTFRMGADVMTIVGVGPKGFTGTETGLFTDVFVPTMMYEGVTHDNWSWFRTFSQLRPGGNPKEVAQRLGRVWRSVQSERAKTFKGWPKERLQQYLDQTIVLEQAGTGVSEMRSNYRVALLAIGSIAAMVLAIAAANVANLMVAQSTARAREMALRLSLGAGRRRLMQLMLVESALLMTGASLVAMAFAIWAAPFLVAHINPADQPARLALPADWRVAAFAVTLCCVVTAGFGLLPALRASAVRPAAALKGGEQPRGKGRLMFALLTAQVCFCFAVQFGAGLFASTLRQLEQQPTGFSADRLVTLDVTAVQPQATEYWTQAAEHLRALPGVESATVAWWPLLSGWGSNGFVSVGGAAPGKTLAYFLPVSPGWLDAMRIARLSGRDIREQDASSNVALVNRAFAEEYFRGLDPVGRSFDRGNVRFQVVGVTANARYRNMREPITPTAYIPLSQRLDHATIFVKTKAENPRQMSATLRRGVKEARSELFVSNVRTQEEINRAQTVRERLLGAISRFFSAVALCLSAVGLYGILTYTVQQRQREFGIRLAIGAPARDIARRVTRRIAGAVVFGMAAGAAVGFLLQPYVGSLLYGAQRWEGWPMAGAGLTIAAAAALAAVPAVKRALRLDPAQLLRSD